MSAVKSLPNITLRLCGQDWFGNVERHAYTTGGAPALNFVDSHGEEICVLSVNVPELASFPPETVAIKDYSENEGVFAQLVALKIIEPLPQQITSGFVTIPLGRIISPELKEAK